MIERHTEELPSDVPGLTSNRILAFLHDAVIWKRPQHCLEIGPWMGRSSVAICDALETLGGDRTLTSVDFFIQRYSPAYLEKRTLRLALARCGPEVDAIYRDFTTLKMLEDCFNLTKSRHPSMQSRSRLVKAYAADADLSDTPMVDFVFIDADSTYNGTRTNLLKALERMNPGAVVIIDGYMPRFQGLVDIVDEMREARVAEYLGIEEVDIALGVPDPAALRDVLHALKPRDEVEVA